jgi:hypothetical protein
LKLSTAGETPTTLYLTKEQITKVCAKKGEPTCENYKRLSMMKKKLNHW